LGLLIGIFLFLTEVDIVYQLEVWVPKVGITWIFGHKGGVNFFGVIKN